MDEPSMRDDAVLPAMRVAAVVVVAVLVPALNILWGLPMAPTTSGHGRSPRR